MRCSQILLCSAALLAATSALAGPRIGLYSGNPHYLAMDGRPVFFLGATQQHSWTPISRPEVDFLKELDRLGAVMERIGSPHVRAMVRCLPYDPMNHLHDGDVSRTLQPWKRLEDGRFDLEQFEPTWEKRLRAYLEAARERSIMVCLEIWDDWSVTRGEGGAWNPGPDGAWSGHPFNPDNNIQYGRDVLPHTTTACDAPFYRTLPSRDNNAAVLELQKRYVRHLASIAVEYPNVLFNLSNETRASLEWSRYWAEFVRELLPQDRLIGEMPSTNRRDGGGECDPDLNALTLATDGRYDFVDVAQGVSGHEFGADPVRQALGGGERIRRYRQAMTAAEMPKPLILSKEYTRDANGGTIVLWSRFIGGTATARFHRPGRQGVEAVSNFQFRAIENLGRFVAEIPFWTMQPAPEAVARVESAEGVNVLARRGAVYVVQVLRAKEGGRVVLALAPGRYEAGWIDPEKPWEKAFEPVLVSETSPAPVALAWPRPGEHWVLWLRSTDRNAE